MQPATTAELPAIVFVHGILGFDCLGVPPLELCYFRRLRDRLSTPSCTLHFPALPPVGRVEQRAHSLAGYLEQVDGGPIHLIAHSMGGLDARHLIAHLDPAHRVRSVATVGTPHRGTPLAEWALEGRGPMAWLARRVALPGLHDLTPTACARFNERTPDRPDVSYQSYAGLRPPEEMPPWYRPWTRLVRDAVGDNDSQVPEASARWGSYRGTLRADHLELVGWNLAAPNGHRERPFAHTAFYAGLVEEAIAQAES